MAHKTLISGTAYEISGGRTPINGTGYSIDKGKTLVGGTVYEVGFGKPVTVTLTGSVSNSYAEYNGTRYTFPSTFEANIGDTINFHCGDVPSSATIFLNNNQVASGVGSANHSYTVASDLNVNLQTSGSGSSVQAKMYITEIPEGHALVQITGTGYNMAYNACSVTIDGINYTAAKALAVPVGTIITCYICDHSSSYGPAYVNVNGNTMLSAGASVASYDFTVNRDTSIALKYERDKTSDGGGICGYVIITEQ